MLISVFIIGSVFAEKARSTKTYMVEMRDGIQLATKVYLPDKGDGPWPVRLSMSPYGKGTREEQESPLSRGIAVVIQDVRGTGESEGDYCFLSSNGWGELQDGYDTVEWILTQKWCNGKIATTGGSALGATQILLAGTGPRGIVGQHLTISADGNYRAYYTNGVFHKMFSEFLIEYLKLKEESQNILRSHYTYDDYWKTQQIPERADKVNWPIFMLTGWYDLFCSKGTIETFRAIKEKGGSKAKENIHIVIGPWGHGENKPGGYSFPNSSTFEEISDQANLVDHWLLGKPHPKQPTIKYYTMGELPGGKAPGNEWKTTSTWPPKESKLVPFYINDQSILQFTKPSKGKVNFVYDPHHPVPSTGGQTPPFGPLDQRENEKRDDVIVFSTPVLKEPIEVTGEMQAILYVSTSTVDTDFVVTISDVYPDGRSLILSTGIQRLSFRNSLEKHELAKPRNMYRIEIDLLSTSMVFNKGHKIRVSITSSWSPWFEPNPNTGVPNDSIENAVKAKQTIYMGGENASYIHLPIVGSLKGLD
jgi:uncharacterized protein